MKHKSRPVKKRSPTRMRSPPRVQSSPRKKNKAGGYKIRTIDTRGTQRLNGPWEDYMANMRDTGRYLTYQEYQEEKTDGNHGYLQN